MTAWPGISRPSPDHPAAVRRATRRSARSCCAGQKFRPGRGRFIDALRRPARPCCGKNGRSTARCRNSPVTVLPISAKNLRRRVFRLEARRSSSPSRRPVPRPFTAMCIAPAPTPHQGETRRDDRRAFRRLHSARNSPAPATWWTPAGSRATAGQRSRTRPHAPGRAQARYQLELDKALAKRDLAEINIARAQIAETDAEIDLSDQMIARARLAAPFDFVVVNGDLSQAVGKPVSRATPCSNWPRSTAIASPPWSPKTDIEGMTRPGQTRRTAAVRAAGRRLPDPHPEHRLGRPGRRGRQRI